MPAISAQGKTVDISNADPACACAANLLVETEALYVSLPRYTATCTTFVEESRRVNDMAIDTLTGATPRQLKDAALCTQIYSKAVSAHENVSAALGCQAVVDVMKKRMATAKGHGATPPSSTPSSMLNGWQARVRVRTR